MRRICRCSIAAGRWASTRCITIESFDPDMENIAKLCCIWRKMADSPEQLATEGLRFLKQVQREVYGPQSPSAITR